jgi:hypothetical protein
MPVRLNGSTSGYTELDAPAVAGNNNIKMPASNGAAFQIVRNGVNAGELEYADKLVLSTAKASTSGTSIDFSPSDGTGIPSWAKRVTLMFSGVGTSGGNGTSGNNFRIILGTSSGLELTGYSLIAGLLSTAGELITSTAGFVFQNYSNSTRVNGSLTLNNLSGNTWVATGLFGSIYVFNVTGSKALASALTRLQITTVNGTDTFNAGSINIMYE